jgi:hypothetical protein
MAIPSLLPRLGGFASFERNKALRCLAAVAVAVAVWSGCSLFASARPAKDFEPATLVEAAQYIPCRDSCFALQTPASAFCFRLRGEFVVAEQKGLLRDVKSASTDDLSRKEAEVKIGALFISVHMADHPSMKLTRGSLYEGFNENGCIAEVHKPIIAHANATRRSPKIPSDAMAIAGSGRGDFQPLYLWYECIPESDSGTIGCGRWYGNGDSDGKDWYCAQTADGKALGTNYAIDQVLSQAGRLVLTSGAVLRHDNRARTNDKLDRPGEACR